MGSVQQIAANATESTNVASRIICTITLQSFLDTTIKVTLYNTNNYK